MRWNLFLPLVRGGALAVVIAVSGLAVADSPAIRFFEDAVTRFNAGDLSGARIQLKNSLRHDPSLLSARILMGRVQLQLGNPQLAEEELLQAEQLGADPVLTTLPLARARNRLGKYAANLEAVVPTRLPMQHRPDLWVELGIARLNSDDVPGARMAFERALAIQPGHSGGTLGLARIPLHEGDYAEAQRLAEIAAANDPNQAEAWFIKGSALHGQGQYLEAAAAYRRSAEVAPGHSAAALGEATALLDAGQWAEAAALFETLGKSYPWMPEAPYLRSKALQRLGRDQEAAQALQAAADILDPVSPADIADNPALVKLAALIAYDSGQLERAYQAASLYLEKRPADTDARKLLARIALRMQKPSYARRALLPLVADGRADAETLALLGDANLQQNDYAAAERNYREAIRRHRGGPAVIGRLGATQFRQGQRERALQTLQRLVDRTPPGAASGASLYLGMLYFAEGRLQEAREIADSLVEEQPDNLLALNLQATLAVAAGDRVAGQRMLKTLLSKAPRFRPARFNLAKVYVIERRYQEAADILNSLLVEDPSDIRALQESARLALARDDRRSAIHLYEKIRQIDKAARLPLLELVDLYLDAQRPGDAMNVVRALERQLPNDFLVQLALARVQLARGDPGDARETLKSTVLLAGFDPRLLLQAARLQIAARAYEDAAQTLTRLLDERPESLAARRELVTALFRQRKLDRAEAELEAIFARAPDDLFALALLGDIRMMQGQAAEAAGAYGRALQQADLPELVVSRYRARTMAGQGQAALAELRAWHRDHPDQPLVLRALAERLHRDGDAKAAWPLYQRLIELMPEDALIHNNLANLLLDLDSERALKAAHRAHQLAPDHPDVLDTYGWILVQLGDPAAGLKYLREAVARDGRSASARYHLGVALQEFGSPDEARRELAQALTLGREFDGAEDARLRLQYLRAAR